jgi:hypothetical protein
MATSVPEEGVRRRRRGRALTLVLGVALLIAGAGTIVVSFTSSGEPAPLPTSPFTVPTAQLTPAEVPAGSAATSTPNTIAIPALGVSASVVLGDVYASLPGPDKVAEHQASAPLLGPAGTTLIAGHVSSYGVDGALKWLSRLKAGDRVYVTASDGTPTAWMVSGVIASLKGEQPADLTQLDGPRRLALVTCGGRVITRADGSRHYDSNVIAYAVPVPGENPWLRS